MAFRCPYCNSSMPKTSGIFSEHYPCFSAPNGEQLSLLHGKKQPATLCISYYHCPECGQFSIFASGMSDDINDIGEVMIRPNSLARQFPEYIPDQIRTDYEEAYSIVNLSPKASATLSRRCLQSMIRDFWGITKKRLVDEIDALEGKVPAQQWLVLHSLRKIGNIGAHPEADVNLIIDINPEDAIKLLKVIELLMQQWYVERHQQELLYGEITNIDDATKAQRNSAL